VGEPSLDDFVRRVVVPKGCEQDLSSAIELTAKDTVRAVGLVERSTGVLDRCPEVIGCMFVLEALDAVAVSAREEEPYHHVVEAAVDEVFDDRSKPWLPTKLFKQAHPRDDPDAM
jgi:hypothetical protein